MSTRKLYAKICVNEQEKGGLVTMNDISCRLTTNTFQGIPSAFARKADLAFGATGRPVNRVSENEPDHSLNKHGYDSPPVTDSSLRETNQRIVRRFARQNRCH